MTMIDILKAVLWQEGYLIQDPLHALNTVDSLELRLGHLVDVPVPARRHDEKEPQVCVLWDWVG